MTELQIIGLPQSNFVWATRIFIAERGVSHTMVTANPHSPEIERIHPYGKVPVMQHGGIVLAESRAICGYVDSSFVGIRLIPDDPVRAAKIEEWTSIICTTIEPLLIRQYIFAYMFPKTKDGQPDRELIDQLTPRVEHHLDILEKAMNEGKIDSGVFTMVDAYLIPILFYLCNAPESKKAIDDRPLVREYLSQQLERESVQSTMPPSN